MTDFFGVWQGRNDGEDPLQQRLYRRVVDGSSDNVLHPGDFGLCGFAVDEGVARNQGRVGAAAAPDMIRSAMANFPVTTAELRVIDFGNISCSAGRLEEAQNALSERVRETVRSGARSVVLGGGHEVMYGHFSGLRNAFPTAKIGIINIDAHFDNRELQPAVGATSGTGFWQIAQQEPLNSLHIGIQRNSNTLKLFDTAHQLGMKYILADEIFFENLPSIYERIDELIAGCDLLYVTICMDVFSVAVAPGVSAAAYNGLMPDAAFMHMYRHILRNDKLVALDVAEVNPTYDIDNHTARLAAALVNEWLMTTL